MFSVLLKKLSAKHKTVIADSSSSAGYAVNIGFDVVYFVLLTCRSSHE